MSSWQTEFLQMNECIKPILILYFNVIDKLHIKTFAKLLFSFGSEIIFQKLKRLQNLIAVVGACFFQILEVFQNSVFCCLSFSLIKNNYKY